MIPTIIDTHTHLYDVPDPDGVLRLSAEGGVSGIVVLGVDYASNIKHLDICKGVPCGCPGQANLLEVRKIPDIYLALGIHPGSIVPGDVEKCFSLFNNVCRGIPCGCLDKVDVPKVAAIGEIGLDFWYKWVRRDDVKKDEQRAVFQRQLDLAKEFDLPVVVHSRGTWRECLERLVATGIRKADFHWYSGPSDVLKDILDAGYMISVSPALEYSPDSRRAGAYAPLDRILVETDTPVAFPGKNDGLRVPSTPKDVWRTFDALCALRNCDRDQALEQVNANARAFFNICISG